MVKKFSLEDLQAEEERIDSEMDAEAGKGVPVEEPAAKAPANTDTATPPVNTAEIAAPAEVVTAPGETVIPPAVQDTTDWKAKYDEISAAYEKLKQSHAVLQGKTYAEVPRVNAENKSLREQLGQAQGELEAISASKDAEIEALNQKIAELSKVAPAAQMPMAKNAGYEKLKAEHGEDIADTILEMISPYEAQINDLKTQLAEAKKPAPKEVPAAPASAPAGTASEGQAEDFYTQVFLEVPDWTAINGNKEEGIPPDPNWPVFLETKDPITGYKYRTVAMTAMEKGNAAEFVRTFKAFKGAPAAKPATKPAATGEFSKELENQIDPATIGGGKPAPTTVKPTYPRAEMDRFYEDYRKGRLVGKMTQEEISAKMLEYEIADDEGRIKG